MPIFKSSTLSICIAALLLTACGSGGGGGSADAGAAPSTSSTPAATPAIVTQASSEAAEVKTEDLVAPEDFDFATQQTYSLTVTAPKAATSQQVRVYHNYVPAPAGSDSAYLADFQSLLASTRLMGDSLTLELALSVTTQSLLVELWDATGAAPSQAIITLGDDTRTLEWSFN